MVRHPQDSRGQAVNVGLTFIKRRRAAAKKAAKTRKRNLLRRTKPKPTPAPHGGTTHKGRKTPRPQPRTVAA